MPTAFIAIEASHVWLQPYANGLGPDVQGAWKAGTRSSTGRVQPAPPDDSWLLFRELRVAQQGHDGAGFLVVSPATPFPRGRYSITFRFVTDARGLPPDAPFVSVDMAADPPQRKIAFKTLTAGEVLSSGPAPWTATLQVDLPAPTNNVEVRVYWHGHGRLVFIRADGTIEL